MDLLSFSEGLTAGDGGRTLRTAATRHVDFPADGHDGNRALEASSFWFAHRNAVILDALERHRPGAGPFLDVGGGNGFVTRALVDGGHPAVLVEPGAAGIRHGLDRQLPLVIHGTLEDAAFHDGIAGAIGLFDVIEHVADPLPLLREVRRVLAPGGALVVTVPAHRWLWSEADRSAGHHRRYTQRALAATLGQAGFSVVEGTHFFTFLAAPVLLLRALPDRLRPRRESMQATAIREHQPDPRVRKVLDGLGRLERAALRRGRALPVGTSLLAVARPR